MAFFLETLLGGLMTGMLYALVALGFVLIFKASGVFNFAQGAMVLFAALAMARFAEWLPQWFGFESKLLANMLAFAIAAVIMFGVAWLIERLVLRHLVNQEGATLLMATLGIAYFLDGLGQTLFGSAIYKIDIGMPKEPIFVLDTIFPGGLLVNKEDVIAAVIAAALVAGLALFFQKTSTGRGIRTQATDKLHRHRRGPGGQRGSGQPGTARLARDGTGHSPCACLRCVQPACGPFGAACVPGRQLAVKAVAQRRAANLAAGRKPAGARYGLGA